MSDGATPSPDPATVELILSWTNEGLARQLADHDSLERRLTQTFSAAAVVVGLAGLANLSHPSDGEVAVLVTMLVWFVGVAGAAIVGAWTRPYRFVDYGDTLWAHCHSLPAYEVRHFLVSKIPEAIVHNRALGKIKARCLRWALIATGLEVISLGVLLVLRATR